MNIYIYIYLVTQHRRCEGLLPVVSGGPPEAGNKTNIGGQHKTNGSVNMTIVENVQGFVSSFPTLSHRFGVEMWKTFQKEPKLVRRLPGKRGQTNSLGNREQRRVGKSYKRTTENQTRQKNNHRSV